MESVLFAGGRACGLRLRGGSVLKAPAVILAVPPGRLDGEDVWRQGSQRELDAAIGFSPIITVYLWFDGHPVTDEMVGFVGRTVQWVFDRTSLAGRDPARDSSALQSSVLHESSRR